jgi:hypothetical protein
MPVAARERPDAVTHQPDAVTHQPAVRKTRKLTKAKSKKPVKRPKKRKSLFRKFAEEAFDLVEDIFD